MHIAAFIYLLVALTPVAILIERLLVNIVNYIQSSRRRKNYRKNRKNQFTY